VDANWISLVNVLTQEIPGFKIVDKKTSKLMWFFNFFTRLWNPLFMERYTVTLGRTIYMPAWLIGTRSGYMVLRHEAVHLRDLIRWGPLYVISYLAPPIGPSFKAYWEYRGYVESMRVYFEIYGEVPDKTVDFWVEQFTSSTYLWMFPIAPMVRGWFKRDRDRIMKESK
jgi:hypothetical protein